MSEKSEVVKNVEKYKFSYEPYNHLTDICSTCTNKIDTVSEERKCFVCLDYVKESIILAFCFAEEGKMPKFLESLFPGARVCETCFEFIGKLEKYPFIFDGEMEKSLMLNTEIPLHRFEQLDLLTLPTESLNTMWKIKEQMKSLPYLAKVYAHFAVQTLTKTETKEGRDEELNSSSSSTISSSSSSYFTPEKSHEFPRNHGSLHSTLFPRPFMRASEKFGKYDKIKATEEIQSGSENPDGAKRESEIFLTCHPPSETFGSRIYSSGQANQTIDVSTFPPKIHYSLLASSFDKHSFDTPVSETRSKRRSKTLKRMSPYFGAIEELTEEAEEYVNIESTLPLNQLNVGSLIDTELKFGNVVEATTPFNAFSEAETQKNQNSNKSPDPSNQQCRKL